MAFAVAAGISDIPVLSDSSTTSVESVFRVFEHDFFVPSLSFLSPDMTALSVDESVGGLSSVSELIDTHL
jgi:hypothetical protein